MTENEFNELWLQAEAERYSKRLVEDYPEWRQSRSRVIRTTTMIFAFVIVTVSILTVWLRQPQGYENVYCNRAGTTDAQWVTMAAEMLME